MLASVGLLDALSRQLLAFLCSCSHTLPLPRFAFPLQAGETALHLAAKFGADGVVKLIIKKFPSVLSPNASVRFANDSPVPLIAAGGRDSGRKAVTVV